MLITFDVSEYRFLGYNGESYDMTVERDQAKVRLSGSVAYRIARLNAETVRLLTLLCEANDFKFHVWKVFSAIGSYAPISAVEIGRMTTTDKAMVSRVIRQLLDRDLVERELNEFDARLVNIQLTANGTKIYRHIAGEIDKLQQRLFEGVPAEKINDLIEMINLLENRTRIEFEAAQTKQIFTVAKK